MDGQAELAWLNTETIHQQTVTHLSTTSPAQHRENLLMRQTMLALDQTATHILTAQVLLRLLLVLLLSRYNRSNLSKATPGRPLGQLNQVFLHSRCPFCHSNNNYMELNGYQSSTQQSNTYL